ncbi:hypothetical protein AAG906_010733 [Vitis piasezkii]
MMDLGNARRILDMEIVRNRKDRTLFLSQKGYLEKVLKRATHVCNGVLTTKYFSFINFKWLLRYVRGSLGVGLKFGYSKEGVSITSYVDLDYVGDLDKRRSTTGYIFTLFGGHVSWKPQLQSIVVLSTTELQGLVKELGVYHFIRETVSSGAMKLEKISTTNNPADMATKVLLWIFGGNLDPWM